MRLNETHLLGAVILDYISSEVTDKDNIMAYRPVAKKRSQLTRAR
jgi:hypothetical protein